MSKYDNSFSLSDKNNRSKSSTDHQGAPKKRQESSSHGDFKDRDFKKNRPAGDSKQGSFGKTSSPTGSKSPATSSETGRKPVGQSRSPVRPGSAPTATRRPSSSSGQRFGTPSRGGVGQARGMGGNRPTRPIKKLNPSDFIKKVEEQVIAPVYVPKHAFADFKIAEQLKENIIKKGYVTPTPIQDQTIPFLLEGKDLVGTANTGTGKTAAFLIPLVNNLLTKKTHRVLIITPTRELAAQIQEELELFKAGMNYASVLCIGGLNINVQINVLKKNPTFVIGTPGRLKDLEKNNFLNLSTFDAIVLDEVDTMLDMGFINDMKYLIAKLPKKRHSLFFSATISKEIKQVMDVFLTNPVAVNVKARQTSENINQDVIHVGAGNKVDMLHDLLIKPEFSKVIVFSRTQRATDKLAKELKLRGFEVATIHGRKTQAQRKKALETFKKDQVRILLATDVVARGIDINDVTHVINFDLPESHEDYIHRIGRTGRASKIGQAITFID